MTRQIVLETHGSRRQLLPGEKKTTPMSTVAGKEERQGVGEVAGGTAAACAAICCCCPCAVMDLLVLAVYKVPAGLCRKAWRKRQRRRMKKKKKKEATALLQQREQQGRQLEATSSSSSKGGTGSSFGDSEFGRSDGDDGVVGERSAAEFDTEMWDRFHGGGFWRSSSQRES